MPSTSNRTARASAPISLSGILIRSCFPAYLLNNMDVTATSQSSRTKPHSGTRKPRRRVAAKNDATMVKAAITGAPYRSTPYTRVVGRRKTLVTAASATCHLCRGRRRMPPVSSKCAHRPSSLTSMRQPSSALSMESANHACAPSAPSKSLVATTLPCGSMTLNATMRVGYPGRSVFNRSHDVFAACGAIPPRVPAWPRRCCSDVRWRLQPNSVQGGQEHFGS